MPVLSPLAEVQVVCEQAVIGHIQLAITYIQLTVICSQSALHPSAVRMLQCIAALAWLFLPESCLALSEASQRLQG